MLKEKSNRTFDRLTEKGGDKYTLVDFCSYMFLRPHASMICLEEQYFSINKILLRPIGLWPNEQSKFTRFQFIFFSCIIMEFIIFQLTVLITSRLTLDLIIKVFSNALLFSVIEIQYIMIGVNIKTMKEILAEFQQIYNNINEENEVAITEKYGYNARRSTAILAMLALCMLFVLIIVQYRIDIFNVVLQINTSRSRNMLIITEYFVNQENYFDLILLHINITICIGIFIMIATGTMLITFFYCIYGMFRIARYRMEYSININMLNSNMKDKNLIFKRIICAIDIQRQAMKLSVFLVSRFETMTSCLIILGVSSLSLNLFQITSITEMLPRCSCVIIIILYMFIANYLGQELMDHNKDVFSAAYNIQWYVAPVKIQRLILFLLQRSSKDFNVNIGGLFIPSLEGFTTLVKASVSYFTVIHSTR